MTGSVTGKNKAERKIKHRGGLRDNLARKRLFEKV